MTLALEQVGYRYPSAEHPAVEGIDLTVQGGEVVLLTGPTGCGKSTLLRLCAGLLQRHGQGEVFGRITIDGTDPAQAPPAQRVTLAGFVSQEPGDQLVAGNVADELAFAMESARAQPADMEAAIPGLLAAVGLAVSPDRSCAALSGGQTQRLVTGAALSAGAGLLLLDEPLAQLDPGGAQVLLERLAALAAGGVAVVMVEHRLEAALPWCSRVVVMESGRLCADAPAAALAPGSPLLATLRRLGLTVPGMLDLADRLGGDPADFAYALPPPPVSQTGPVIVSAAGLRYRYPQATDDALHPTDITLHAGERVAILGSNGAGKSTLLGLLSGRLAGGPALSGVVVAVPQDPDLSLFRPTVAEELAYGPTEQRRPEVAAVVSQVARALSVDDLRDRAPQALSRGQRLRCAVAAAATCQPALLILDEPTSGQDHDQIERMMAALSDTLADGVLLFATHDVDLALRWASRAVVLHQGRVLADGPPGAVLGDLPDHVPLVLPPLARLCRDRGLPTATAEALAAVATPAPPRPLPPLPPPPPLPPVPAATPRPPPRGLDPRARLGLIGCAGILAITLERPAALVLLTVCCALPLLRVPMTWPWRRRGLLAVAAIIWSTTLSQGLFYAEQPRVSLGSLGPLHLYREGVTYGLAQSMRFVGLSLAGIALTLSTPPDRMFAALVKLKVPFGLALMAATALRFLPELGREVLTVRRARAARGRPVWQRGPVAWLKLELALLRPMVARAWRRALSLAESLDARGFDPLAPRTMRRPLTLRALDGVVLTAAAAVSLSALGARLIYALYTTDTLYIPALRPLYGFVRGWL